MPKRCVLVAGIGGASLGTEILKCLQEIPDYRLVGCDISPYAYGHYQLGRESAFLVRGEHYIDDVLSICRRFGVVAIIPGGEKPLQLLTAAQDRFDEARIHIASNTSDIVRLCCDKARLFERLVCLNIPVPWTAECDDTVDLSKIPLPCIIKPSTGSGGSRLTFLAGSVADIRLYSHHLVLNGCRPLVQEYIPVSEGEFTVGVLSLPDGVLVGAVAMRRMFHSQLSVSSQTELGLISSGFSQGFVDDYRDVTAQAESIAQALGSAGPMNIQGRMKGGAFVPFEINPRFSASTYLRALAGFNEIDVYLKAVLGGVRPGPIDLRPGL